MQKQIKLYLYVDHDSVLIQYTFMCSFIASLKFHYVK